MDGFDICTVLCDGCEMQTGTSRNLIVRTKFERYVKTEILDFINFVNCQAEEGLMRAHGSIPCGFVPSIRKMQEDCSCMRICGTGGLVGSVSSRR